MKHTYVEIHKHTNENNNNMAEATKSWGLPIIIREPCVGPSWRDKN